MLKPSLHTVFITLTTVFAASGCGGGSSGSETTSPPASAPTLSATYGVKQLKFSWDTVATATSYMLFENPDGASNFTQVGPSTSGTAATVDITTYSFNWQKAQFAIKACNSAGCSALSSPFSVEAGMLPSIGFFKPSNTKANMFFGLSVAYSADGTTLVVGARQEASSATGINGNQADMSQPSAGAAYVYTLNNGTWTQQA